ncbi:MAG: xanthine dehydrogenase family protein molybdopterin-binding subunit, partial [Acidimicrobiales bacterium]
VSDLDRPGSLHGAIKFSEHAHARIVGIDVSAARRLPGVRAVITAADVPEMRMGFLGDNVALKGEKVRQFRDEVAAVAAIDADIAREAVDLIDVEYEPLPALFTPEDALADGAVLVHETDPRGRPNSSNLVPLRCSHDSGDVDRARSESSFVVEGRYSVPRIQQACLGPAGCIAELDLRGNLTITAKTQIPFLAQRDFTRALEVLGLAGRNVRVVVPAVGGAFGSGLDTHAYEYIAILLAWSTAEPVRIVYEREEEFSYLSPRQSADIFIRQGCDRHGALTFREIEVVQDNGAYVSWGATYPNVMLPTATTLYRVPNVRFDAKIVYTNNTYCQAMRGYGNPEVTWAIESNLDDLAAVARMDPLDLRLLNCNEAGDPSPMGLRINTCGLRECLETTGRSLDRSRARAGRRDRRRGVGIASLINVGGGGKIYRSDGSGIILKLDDFGNVNVAYGGVEMGQGLHSALALMVAEAVGVEPDRVLVNQTDTASSPWDVGTHASRGAFMAGNAARMAAAELRARIFAAAERVYAAEVRRNLAELGEGTCEYDFDSVTADRFELVDGWLHPADAADQPWLRVRLDRLLRALHFADKGGTGTIFTEEAFYEPPTDLPDWSSGMGNMSAAYTFGVQGVEVEVDELTGEVEILRIVAVTDIGRVLSRQAVEGQLYGGIVQGVGYALYEQIICEEGRILNPGFTDYKLVSAADLDFPIELHWVETHEPAGPFGAKGAGEAGIIATAPAIANAVHDAVGVRIRDLPITPEKVLAALAEKADHDRRESRR